MKVVAALGDLIDDVVVELSEPLRPATDTASNWHPDTLARVRMVLLTGFMGAFTTYSTYAFQSAMLLQEAKWGLAIGNIAGQTIIGILAIFAGLYLGKAVF